MPCSLPLVLCGSCEAAMVKLVRLLRFFCLLWSDPSRWCFRTSWIPACSIYHCQLITMKVRALQVLTVIVS